jgi:hypothetical protein
VVRWKESTLVKRSPNRLNPKRSRTLSLLSLRLGARIALTPCTEESAHTETQSRSGTAGHYQPLFSRINDKMVSVYGSECVI